MATRTIDLDEIRRKTAEDDFWALRGKSIQHYANLEQALCRLFSRLGDIQPGVAEIVFFKIASSDARNKVIEQLFRRKFHTQFNLFRNSLFRQLRPIDLERNEIVHWNVVNKIDNTDDDGNTNFEVTLMPPTYMSGGGDVSKSKKDLVAFIEKCFFYIRLINNFCTTTGLITVHGDDTTEAEQRTWHEIFHQPIIYPPPITHPLSLKRQAPGTPPQSLPR